MPKGPLISPTAKWIIVEEALKDRKYPRMALAAKVRNILSDMNLRPPSEDTIAKLISWARNHAPSQTDTQWSIGLSEKYGIPSEAYDDLLFMWRHCLATGHSFNIREAKWAAKLRNVGPFSLDSDGAIVSRFKKTSYRQKALRIMLLKIWCSLYAAREQSCEILGIACETSDLDASLFMKEPERIISIALDKVPAPFWSKEQQEELRLKLQQYSAKAQQTALEELGRDGPMAWQAVMQELTRSKTIELPIETKRELFELDEDKDLTFAHCLSYLHKGPKWQRLSAAEHKEIIVRQLTWLKQDKIMVEWQTALKELDEGKEEHLRQLLSGMKRFDITYIIDQEVLRMVGYDVSKHIKEKKEA